MDAKPIDTRLTEARLVRWKKPDRGYGFGFGFTDTGVYVGINRDSDTCTHLRNVVLPRRIFIRTERADRGERATHAYCVECASTPGWEWVKDTQYRPRQLRGTPIFGWPSAAEIAEKNAALNKERAAKKAMADAAFGVRVRRGLGLYIVALTSDGISVPTGLGPVASVAELPGKVERRFSDDAWIDFAADHDLDCEAVPDQRPGAARLREVIVMRHVPDHGAVAHARANLSATRTAVKAAKPMVWRPTPEDRKAAIARGGTNPDDNWSSPSDTWASSALRVAEVGVAKAAYGSHWCDIGASAEVALAEVRSLTDVPVDAEAETWARRALDEARARFERYSFDEYLRDAEPGDGGNSDGGMTWGYH